MSFIAVAFRVAGEAVKAAAKVIVAAATRVLSGAGSHPVEIVIAVAVRQIMNYYLTLLIETMNTVNTVNTVKEGDNDAFFTHNGQFTELDMPFGYGPFII